MPCAAADRHCREAGALRADLAMKIAGYAAVFDHPDKGGDIVRRGAFVRSIRPGLPLLWQHDATQRIGTIDSLAEDDRGLRVIATIDGSRVIENGHGLSFGYRVRAASRGTYRELTDLEILEVSLVNHPMQPRARVLAVENNNPVEQTT
jgi:uncharacterized protein